MKSCKNCENWISATAECAIMLKLTQQDLMHAGIGSCRTAWAHGYVSRRSDPKDRHLQFTHRLKLAFVCVPSWKSSYYCVRQYYNYAACIELAKKEDCK